MTVITSKKMNKPALIEVDMWQDNATTYWQEIVVWETSFGLLEVSKADKAWEGYLPACWMIA